MRGGNSPLRAPEAALLGFYGALKEGEGKGLRRADKRAFWLGGQRTEAGIQTAQNAIQRARKYP